MALALAAALGPLSAAASPEEDMARAASALLASLDETQRASAVHPFDENRKAWHYIPKRRDGLSLKRIRADQEPLVFELLRQGLSEQGVAAVEAVISLEEVLQLIEGPQSASWRDPELYFVWIYGDPQEARWGWRFEGHHISINATIVDGKGISMTPTFLGANPAEVRDGPRQGFRALPHEEDIALRLVRSLDSGQRQKAVFASEAPGDIFTFAERRAQPLPVAGLAFAEMTPGQQADLKALVDVFLARNRTEIRRQAQERIEQHGWESLRFGWAGSLERFGGNYYYVQGPDFLIEYDNTQNGGNHVHSVWRSFEGDFGEDLIGEHRRSHSH